MCALNSKYGPGLLGSHAVPVEVIFVQRTPCHLPCHQLTDTPLTPHRAMEAKAQAHLEMHLWASRWSVGTADCRLPHKCICGDVTHHPSTKWASRSTYLKILGEGRLTQLDGVSEISSLRFSYNGT